MRFILLCLCLSLLKTLEGFSQFPEMQRMLNLNPLKIPFLDVLKNNIKFQQSSVDMKASFCDKIRRLEDLKIRSLTEDPCENYNEYG